MSDALTAYELERERNIADNLKVLQALGLEPIGLPIDTKPQKLTEKKKTPKTKKTKTKP